MPNIVRPVAECGSAAKSWDELEDEAFDFGDDEKGTLIFSAVATSRKCPQCSKPMKSFKYRLYDLEIDFCEDGHGFWLDADEDKRILELMKTGRGRSREKGFRRRPVGDRSPVYALRIFPRQNAHLAGWAPRRGFPPSDRELDATAAAAAGIGRVIGSRLT
jgi:Zn-finger nucleic acid-binding protein